MRFLIVPAGLKPKQLLIYSWLYEHSNQTQEEFKGLKKNEVYASSRKIEEFTEIPQKTVSRNLKELEAGNYIKLIHKGNCEKDPSRYFLTFNDSLSGSLNDSVGDSVESVGNTKLKSNTKTVNDSVNDSVGDSKSNNNLIIESNNRINIYKNIVDKWNSIDGLSNIKKLNDIRKKHINARIADYGIDNIYIVLDLVSKSNFLKGNNNRNWKCDFDWIINTNNFLKILEGKYNKEINVQPKRELTQLQYKEFEFDE